MASIQTRVFWRVSESDATATGSALAEVEGEANTFMASFGNLGDVCAVQHVVTPAGKYGERTYIAIAVTFVEE